MFLHLLLQIWTVLLLYFCTLMLGYELNMIMPYPLSLSFLKTLKTCFYSTDHLFLKFFSVKRKERNQKVWVSRTDFSFLQRERLLEEKMREWEKEADFLLEKVISLFLHFILSYTKTPPPPLKSQGQTKMPCLGSNEKTQRGIPGLWFLRAMPKSSVSGQPPSTHIVLSRSGGYFGLWL